MYTGYNTLTLKDTGETVGTGWLPPMPDLRDYNEENKEIIGAAKKLRIIGSGKPKTLPQSIDLRSWCSPVRNQGQLGSCSAQASVGMVEYFQRRAYNKHIKGSPLFVYKVTRNLIGEEGDSGAWLRNAMGALVLFGVPPEKHWKYTDRDPAYNSEPSSFVYAMADNYESTFYFAHDPLGQNIPRKKVLNSVKEYLAAGIPSMFGFWGFPSFEDSSIAGGVPMPCPGEASEWGHAILAVGYDDKKKIKNTRCNKTTTGAILFRNSWGTGWGEKGYGWIPYQYVLDNLALDFWSLLNMEWVDTDQFGL